MKKKLLFVINSLGLGGAEKSLTSLLNAMDYNRYEVDLLMFSPTGMFLKLVPQQVHILPQLPFLCSNRSVKKQLLHPKYFSARTAATIGVRIPHKLHMAQRYWKYAGFAFDPLEKQYDAAIAWGQGNPTHYVAKKVHAEKKIAVINVNYEGAGHNKAFDRAYYGAYQYIVNVSDDLCKLTKGVFPEYSDRMVTMYDINNAELICKMGEEENPFAGESAAVKIVTAGRMTEQKGYDLAVNAAEILAGKGMDFKWFFVGDGVTRNKIRQMIDEKQLADRVILCGAQENPYKYMKNADIYVQTSRFEGYCLTLGEARMLNTPVISTNFDVVYDQITDGQNGLVVNMDPADIADAVVRMWNDTELRTSIIDNLKKEKKGNIEEIEKLYQMVG